MFPSMIFASCSCSCCCCWRFLRVWVGTAYMSRSNSLQILTLWSPEYQPQHAKSVESNLEILSQATHLAHVLRTCDMNQPTGAHEKAGFEKGLTDQVKESCSETKVEI